MSAKLLFHRKATLIHREHFELAVAELKIWEVLKSDHYPNGVKFSLFLVSKDSGEIVVGIDNHKPKGPHIHLGKHESIYNFIGNAELIEDFWQIVEKEGFEI